MIFNRVTFLATIVCLLICLQPADAQWHRRKHRLPSSTKGQESSTTDSEETPSTDNPEEKATPEPVKTTTPDPEDTTIEPASSSPSTTEDPPTTTTRRRKHTRSRRTTAFPTRPTWISTWRPPWEPTWRPTRPTWQPPTKPWEPATRPTPTQGPNKPANSLEAESIDSTSGEWNIIIRPDCRPGGWCEGRPPAICRQPQKSGPCKGHHIRYFFDTSAGQCRRFAWGGCRPNQNNFLTREACRERCEIAPKPNPRPPTSSPPGPSPANACHHPRKSGPCRASFPRYYHDTRTGQCRRFFWGGCQANGNNFKTLEECQEACSQGQVTTTRRNQGSTTTRGQQWTTSSSEETIPTTTDDDSPVTTKGQQWSTTTDDESETPAPSSGEKTPSTTSSPQTAIASEEIKNTKGPCVPGGPCGANKPPAICQLRRETGECKAIVPRYYFNKFNARCERFTYGGCGGNQNNFVSLQRCQQRCSRDVEGRPVTRAPCQPGQECSGYGTCRLPRQVGSCNSTVVRWYFHWTSQQCVRFRWSGCDANDNNFESLEECRAACDRYNYPPRPSPRPTQRTTYEPTYEPTDEPTAKTTRTPRTRTRPTYTGTWRPGPRPHPPGSPCREPYDQGYQCGKQMITMMYFYDNRSGSCRRLMYRGCGGNRNRFQTVTACQRTCLRLQKQNRERPSPGWRPFPWTGFPGLLQLGDTFYEVYNGFMDAWRSWCPPFLGGGYVG